jgi:hypothetical protein
VKLHKMLRDPVVSFSKGNLVLNSIVPAKLGLLGTSKPCKPYDNWWTCNEDWCRAFLNRERWILICNGSVRAKLCSVSSHFAKGLLASARVVVVVVICTLLSLLVFEIEDSVRFFSSLGTFEMCCRSIDRPRPPPNLFVLWRSEP